MAVAAAPVTPVLQRWSHLATVEVIVIENSVDALLERLERKVEEEAEGRGKQEVVCMSICPSAVDLSVLHCASLQFNPPLGNHKRVSGGRCWSSCPSSPPKSLCEDSSSE